MANFCVSGQHQEFIGFATYIVYQTLFSSTKGSTVVATKTIENTKDYEIENNHSGQNDSAMSAGTHTARKYSLHNYYDITDYAAGSNLATAIATDITNTNTSWGSDLTVNKLVYNVHTSGADKQGSQLYGCSYLKTESESVSTTSYDKVKAAGDKVIHVGWSDTSDDNTHWLRTMARYEAMDNGTSVSDWDERRKAYARNALALSYPTGSNDHTLHIDKILGKDATAYSNLCTFLGVSALSKATWESYVDTYLTAIA